MKVNQLVLALLLASVAAVKLPARTLQTLCSFNGTNGANPLAVLTLGNDGNFYGTTENGGSNDAGTIFQITTNGTLTTLVSFNVTNGLGTTAGLTLGHDGTFYGTTETGGSSDAGTVFKVTTNGTLTTLFSFSNTNGSSPYAGLTLGNDGNLYGTTYSGGSYGVGTVFQITTNGALTTLVSFKNSETDGLGPRGELTLGKDGNFYSTTTQGGYNDYGTIFQVTTNGMLTTLVSFNGSNGAYPEAGLTLGNDGNLYGTTWGGGISNCGTVFQVTTNGTLTTLVSFNGTNGYEPGAMLTLSPDGNFYGTTCFGGNYGDGTIFHVTTNGTLTTLVSFNGTNGANPLAALTLAPDGKFYGTTYSGESNLDGTVFCLVLSPSITSQPQPLTVTNGHPASLVVAADGLPSLAYQWFLNGSNLPDATNSMLTLQNAFPANAGTYTVVVTNVCGSVTSNPAMLTVLPFGIAAPTMLASGQFQFSFDTVTGVNYAVQYSTNLTQWVPLVTLGGAGVPLILIDPNAAGSPQRFYRIVLSPQ